jgi:hypothetical protein
MLKRLFISRLNNQRLLVSEEKAGKLMFDRMTGLPSQSKPTLRSSS